MITCPKCQSTLQDWAQTCQFCGSDVKGVVRPVQAVKKSNFAYGTAPWVWVVYYVLSSLMVLGGVLLTTIFTLGYFATKAAMESRGVPMDGTPNLVGGFFFLIIFFTSITIVVGLGLLFKNEFLRMIATWFLAASVLFIGYNMLSMIGSTVAIIIGVFMMLCNGMLIYCILETNDEC